MILRRYLFALAGTALLLNVPIADARASVNCADAPPVATEADGSVPAIRWSTPGPDWPIALGVDGNFVAAVGEVGEITAYDSTTGEMLWWTLPYGATITAPEVGSRVVAAASGPDVQGFDRASGALLWQHPIEPRAVLALTRRPGRDLLVIGDTLHRITVVDMASGNEVWSAEVSLRSVKGLGVFASPEIVIAMVITRRGVVFIGFDPDTGAERWHVRGPSHSPEPAFAPGVVLMAKSGRTQALVARDVLDGAVRWRVALPGPLGSELSPAADGTHAAILDRCGTVTLVDMNTGTVVWQARVSDAPDRAALRLTPTRVVFTDGWSIASLDRATGSVTRTTRGNLPLHDLTVVGESVHVLTDIDLSGLVAQIDWIDAEAVSLH